MKRRAFLSLVPLVPFAGAGKRAAASPLDDHTVPWQPGESLAERYTEKVTTMLRRIRNTQAENLLEASHVIARTIMDGGTCWYNWDCGHSTTFDLTRGRDGVPEILTPGFEPDEMRDGDCFLATKRSAHPVLAKKDILVIGAPSPWSRDARLSELIVLDSAMGRIRPYSDIWIETGITTVGAVMRLPGMPAPIGPVSGIIGLTTLWMMLADACRILARGGHPVAVRGEGDTGDMTGARTHLHDPLMDDWFDRLMLEFSMIGAEAGAIREAAGMAVDSVLSGGKVWCYSRDYESLAFEASTRRGGLALTQGVSDGGGFLVSRGTRVRPTGRDTVIMGVFSPDDETDLASLDAFRDAGAGVISIGPMTRAGRIPEGRTVPKEADVHIGMMSDTGGIFALPGFERKVCPTSGALLMQLFWVTCLEIAQQIIGRTGNTPAVYFSGAIRGGMEHLRFMNAIYEERGY